MEIYNRVTGKDVRTEEVADGETAETAETETATETAAKPKIDVLIDDKKENIEEASKVTKVLCFDELYNQTCEGNNIVRVVIAT